MSKVITSLGIILATVGLALSPASASRGSNVFPLGVSVIFNRPVVKGQPARLWLHVRNQGPVSSEAYRLEFAAQLKVSRPRGVKFHFEGKGAFRVRNTNTFPGLRPGQQRSFTFMVVPSFDGDCVIAELWPKTIKDHVTVQGCGSATGSIPLAASMTFEKTVGSTGRFWLHVRNYGRATSKSYRIQFANGSYTFLQHPGLTLNNDDGGGPQTQELGGLKPNQQRSYRLTYRPNVGRNQLVCLGLILKLEDEPRNPSYRACPRKK